jgi:hypothetical protein
VRVASGRPRRSTGEKRLAPFSGSDVLRNVCTSATGWDAAPAGRTLPIVIVLARATPTAASAQRHVAAARTAGCRFPRLFMSLPF